MSFFQVFQELWEPCSEYHTSVLDQYSWFNHKITRGGMAWFNQKAIAAGMLQFRDIYILTENRFLNFQELINKFRDVTDCVTYASLVASIPAIWKIIVRDRVMGESMATGIEKVPQGMKLSKFAYWFFVRNGNTKIDFSLNIKQMWEIEFQTEIPEEQWTQILEYPFKEISAMKLRYFQYKNVIRGITTNIKVSKWEEEVSPYCTFCRATPETVLHLLWECRYLGKIWTALQTWFKRKTNVNMNLTCDLVILCTNQGEYKKLVNVMILFVKHYIYVTRCKKSIPTFVGALCNVEFHKVEKYIAKRNNKRRSYRYR